MWLIPTMFHQNVRGGDEKMSTHALQERQAYDIIKDLRFLAFRATKPCFAICLCGTHARFRPPYKNKRPWFLFLLPLWVYLFYWTVTVSFQKAEIESRSLSCIGMRRAYDLVKIKGTKLTVKFFPPAWLRYHRGILLWYGTFSYP